MRRRLGVSEERKWREVALSISKETSVLTRYRECFGVDACGLELGV